MDFKDVKLGMRVVPHSKTADGRVLGLENSAVWCNAQRKQLPYLFVVRVIKDDCYPEVVLSEDYFSTTGDYFLSSDFEKYIPKK